MAETKTLRKLRTDLPAQRPGISADKQGAIRIVTKTGMAARGDLRNIRVIVVRK